MDIIQDFQNLSTVKLSSGHIIKNLTVALICGFLISHFYRWTNKRLGYTGTFIQSLVALAMITAIVIMVIENNLARAFGLVGAMSIIRFRTAVKDIHDILFIFFSLGIGMAAGAGLHLIAFVGTVFVGLVMFFLAQAHYLTEKRREYLLTFSFAPAADNEAPYLPVFEQYCRRHHLVNMKSVGDDRLLDLSFYVVLKKQDQRDKFLLELKEVQDVNNINLFFDEEYS